MPDSQNNHDQHEQQLDALIAEYYRAEEAGQTPDHDEFMAQHPEFAKDLAEFFADVMILPRQDRPDPQDPALEPTITPNTSPRSKAAVGSVVRYFGEYETAGYMSPEQAAGGAAGVFGFGSGGGGDCRPFNFKLWDVSTAEELMKVIEVFGGFAFSPDSKALLICDGMTVSGNSMPSSRHTTEPSMRVNASIKKTSLRNIRRFKKN